MTRPLAERLRDVDRADDFARIEAADLIERSTSWQPASTALKDGTPILVWDAEGKSYYVVVYCSCRRKFLLVEFDNNVAYTEEEAPGNKIDFSHWMPVPQPPANGESTQQKTEG